MALWAFLTMLLGAVAAIFGGLYGTRNHRWIAKAGLEDRAVATASQNCAVEEPRKVYPTPRTYPRRRRGTKNRTMRSCSAPGAAKHRT